MIAYIPMSDWWTAFWLTRALARRWRMSRSRMREPGETPLAADPAMPSRIDWPRGLLRAWIVLSVLWSGTNIAPAAMQFFEAKNGVKHLSFKGIEYDLPNDATDTEIAEVLGVAAGERTKPFTTYTRDEVQNALGKAKEAGASDDVKAFGDALAEMDKAAANRQAVARRDLLTAISYGIGGPISLLIAGLAIAWVLRGFKPNYAGDLRDESVDTKKPQ